MKVAKKSPLRKIASIFFLALFLVYHVGYIGFYWLSKTQIDAEWRAQDEYTGVMKKVSIPVAFPYMPDRDEYVATEGTINIDGKVYRKVLHKYTNNTIHLVLVEDHLSEKLNQSFDDWINSMTGTDTNPSGKSSLIKSLVKEYFDLGKSFVASPLFCLLDKKHFFYITKSYSLSLDIDTPPPQVLV